MNRYYHLQKDIYNATINLPEEIIAVTKYILYVSGQAPCVLGFSIL